MTSSPLPPLVEVGSTVTSLVPVGSTGPVVGVVAPELEPDSPPLMLIDPPLIEADADALAAVLSSRPSLSPQPASAARATEEMTEEVTEMHADTRACECGLLRSPLRLRPLGFD